MERSVQPQKPLEAKKSKQSRLSLFTNSNIEKFIGENLINKIGIILTIIGVAIGAKYSIDHSLISPTTRIILGYLSGLSLLILGHNLKRKYYNFSAVLISGGISILYVMSYFAYGFYDIIPQLLAYFLMVGLTITAFYIAINYKKQVIAQIGLVGAYAIPFLIGDDLENVAALFSYIAIINSGILFISIKTKWKSLYYSSFLFTWLIFLSWMFLGVLSSRTTDEWTNGLIYLTGFSFIFYLTAIAYNLSNGIKLKVRSVFLLLVNVIIYYGIGFYILHFINGGKTYLAEFTFVNAIFHYLVFLFLGKTKYKNNNLSEILLGLVLVFLTLTIPIELDGNWVTLLWTGLAVVLFCLGRTNGNYKIEMVSYPLMLLASLSLIHDWDMMYYSYNNELLDSKILPIWNTNFLSSFIFILGFGLILYVNEKNQTLNRIRKNRRALISTSVLLILITATYCLFALEIGNYFYQLYEDSSISVVADGQSSLSVIKNKDLLLFKNIWIINYTLFFLSALS